MEIKKLPGRTLVFCITKCRGERTRATSEVEKSISIIETWPSSLLKTLEKGSVWKMRKPFVVATARQLWS